MKIEHAVMMLKNVADENQKVEKLDQISEQALYSYNIPLHLYAEARKKYWVLTKKNKLPFVANALLNSASSMSSSNYLTALINNARACAVAIYERLPNEIGIAARKSLSDLLERDVNSKHLLSEYKEEKFIEGLSSALQQKFDNSEHALDVAMSYSAPGHIPESASYNATGLANEYASRGHRDVAEKIFDHVIENTDPGFDFAKLFSVQNCIQGYLKTGSSEFLDKAQARAKTFLNELLPMQFLTELHGEKSGLTDMNFFKFASQSHNPKLAITVIKLLIGIKNCKEKRVKTLNDILDFNVRSGFF
jgi:hypothetical protein